MTAHEKAISLTAALAKINEGQIQVVSRDPQLSLKDRAKLARDFFKSLGLKGIRVRLSRGANCFWVEIFYPEMNHDEQLHAKLDRSERLALCPGCVYDARTNLALEEILQRAFPREIDTSDVWTDYFAPAWLFYPYR